MFDIHLNPPEIEDLFYWYEQEVIANELKKAWESSVVTIRPDLPAKIAGFTD